MFTGILSVIKRQPSLGHQISNMKAVYYFPAWAEIVLVGDITAVHVACGVWLCKTFFSSLYIQPLSFHRLSQNAFQSCHYAHRKCAQSWRNQEKQCVKTLKSTSKYNTSVCKGSDLLNILFICGSTKVFLKFKSLNSLCSVKAIASWEN